MRRLTSVLAIASAVLATALAVTGCAAASAAASISIASAYVPQPTTPGTSVGYLVIRNNGGADQLVSARTSVGGTVVFRTPVTSGVPHLTMRTISGIPIPAHSTVQLIPDSYHLLITGAGPMQGGKAITLRLTFAHAGTVSVVALVTDPESGGSSYFLN